MRQMREQRARQVLELVAGLRELAAIELADVRVWYLVRKRTEFLCAALPLLPQSPLLRRAADDPECYQKL